MKVFPVIKQMFAAVAFLAVIIFATSIVSTCDAAAQIEGLWAGQITTSKDPENPMQVQIAISSPDDTRNLKQLKYSSPRDCRIKADYNGALYVVNWSSGGVCDRLLRGDVSLERQGNVLKYSIRKHNDSSVVYSEQGTLLLSN